MSAAKPIGERINRWLVVTQFGEWAAHDYKHACRICKPGEIIIHVYDDMFGKQHATAVPNIHTSSVPGWVEDEGTRGQRLSDEGDAQQARLEGGS